MNATATPAPQQEPSEILYVLMHVLYPYVLLARAPTKWRERNCNPGILVAFGVAAFVWVAIGLFNED